MKRFKIITTAFITVILFSSCSKITMLKKFYSGKPISKQEISTIPFELEEKHTVVVGVHINNSKKEYKFIFDTGAITMIDVDAAKELGLKKGREMEMPMKGVKPFRLTNKINVSVGKMNVNDFIIPIMDLKHTFSSDLDGFIGSDFLRFFNTTIDYENQKIVLSKKDITSENNKKEYRSEIEVSFPTRFPIVEIIINDTATINGMVDTGSPYSFVFPLSYIEKLNEAHKNQLIKSKGLFARWPGASANYNYILRIQSLKIGKLEFKNIIVLFADFPKMSKTDNVLIGKDFLDKFLIQINYPSEEMFLIPNKNLNFETNMFTTGLRLNKDKNNNTYVKAFWEGTAADNNLINLDDEIISLNGKNTFELSFKEINNILEDNNIKDIKLEIKNKTGIKIIDLKKKKLFPEIVE